MSWKVCTRPHSVLSVIFLVLFDKNSSFPTEVTDLYIESEWFYLRVHQVLHQDRLPDSSPAPASTAESGGQMYGQTGSLLPRMAPLYRLLLLSLPACKCQSVSGHAGWHKSVFVRNMVPWAARSVNCRSVVFQVFNWTEVFLTIIASMCD